MEHDHGDPHGGHERRPNGADLEQHIDPWVVMVMQDKTLPAKLTMSRTSNMRWNALFTLKREFKATSSNW